MVAWADIAVALSPRKNLRQIFERPADTAHLAPLDGIRALSVLWVMLFHAGWYTTFSWPVETYVRLLHTPWMLPIWRGDFGVDVFFVLSGFLIGGMLMRELKDEGRVRIGHFYLRRLMRLWPALLVVVLFEWGFSHPAMSRPAYPIWPNLLYINNFFSLRDVRMAWTWSLAIEEQFYIVVPWLLAALYLRERRVADGWRITVGGLLLVALALAALIVGIVTVCDLHAHHSEIVVTRDLDAWIREYDLLYSKPWMRAGPLLAGLVAARLYRIDGFMARLGSSGVVGALVMLGAVVLAMLATHWPLVAHAARPLEVLYLASFRLLFGVGVAALLLMSLSTHRLGGRLGKWLSAPQLYPIAQLAYAAYLLNPIIATASHRAFSPAAAGPSFTFLVLAFVDIPVTLAAALVLSLLIERPFMNLRALWLRSR